MDPHRDHCLQITALYKCTLEEEHIYIKDMRTSRDAPIAVLLADSDFLPFSELWQRTQTCLDLFFKATGNLK